MAISNVAFIAGSSQHGKACRAPTGSKCVVASHLQHAEEIRIIAEGDFLFAERSKINIAEIFILERIYSWLQVFFFIFNDFNESLIAHLRLWLSR